MLAPFRGFFDPRSELDKMFGDLFGGWNRGSWRGAGLADWWAPAMDAFPSGGDLVLRVELPGVGREDVDITLQDGVLTISGERKDVREDGGEGYYVRERRYGRFRRNVVLPEGVDQDRIHARFDEGVLTVTVEGAVAVTEPKRIRIQGPEGGGSGA